MSRDLRLRPELLDDVAAAFAWYEDASSGMGQEFLRSYFAALSVLERQPTVFCKVHSDFRRVLLSRFPYALYFRIERCHIVVFLLVHGARDPGSIRAVLRTRK